MDKSLTNLWFYWVLLISVCVTSLAQTCNYAFSNSVVYNSCNVLPVLNSSLHWNLHSTNNTVDIAFRMTGTSTDRWVAWALNPSGQRMVGSQALVAFQHSNGSMIAYTSNVNSYSTRLQQGSLSFGVSNIQAEHINGQIIIYATLELNSSLLSTNQVWQEGPVTNDVPQIHAMTSANRASIATVDFRTNGTTTNTTGTTTNTTDVTSCNYAFSNNRVYSSCNVLPVLNSSLHWNLHSTNNTVDIAFRMTGTSTDRWVAWALNPSGQSMVGSQALVAFQHSNGSMLAYTSNVNSLSTTLPQGSLSFGVSNIQAEYINSQIIIYATLELTDDLLATNQVWQEGPVTNDVPQIHAMTSANRASIATVDFRTNGTTTNTTGTTTNTTDVTSCNYAFSNNRVYSSCSALPVLSSNLYWNLNAANNTVDIAFRKTEASTDQWVAWALNPSGQSMVGSQALVAFQHSNGSMLAYTSNVNSLSTTLPQGSLSFGVSNIQAEYINSQIIIYATLELTDDLLATYQVWQEGPVSGDVPQAHSMSSANKASMATVDFRISGTTTTGGGSNSRTRRRNVHGVLNAVSWGTLMPLGVMMARYLKVFKAANPAWFYLHVVCQSSAYVVGVAGWATGIKLGSDSAGTTYSLHRNIGIALFVLGTVQVFALLLRPKPDHKYRLYWNIYHWSMGYAVIILSIINIYEGLDILNTDGKWKRIYTGILIFLGANAALLEAFTWYIVIKRKKSENSNKHTNGTNGVNPYSNGARSQHTV